MFEGNFGHHPAATTKCRHCGIEMFLDEAEICIYCGPICGNCLNEPCPNKRKRLTKSPTGRHDNQGPLTTSEWDIDSGLGIGGINNDQSMPAIPSERAIARAQHMQDTDIVCRRCHASQNFDGAMFTTSGTDICDDCF